MCPAWAPPQQIQAIEEAMENKECSQYLNIHNMGMVFWSAGAY